MTTNSAAEDAPVRTQSAASDARRSDAPLWRRLAREMGRERGRMGLALGLYAPTLALRVAQPFLIGIAVDRGFRARDLDAIALWAALYLLTVVAQSCTEMGQLFLLQRAGQSVLRQLRARLFAKIQRLPMRYFDRTPLGRTMTRVTNDVESIGEVFASGGVQMVGDVLYLVGTLVALVWVDWRLALSAMVTLPVLYVGVQWFRTRARAVFREVRAKLSALNAYLQEHLTGMHIVQLFGQERRIRARFAEENDAYNFANRSAIALDAGVYSFVDAMATVAVALVLVTGAELYTRGWLTVGVLVAFVQALERFFFPIRELSNRYTVLQNALTSAERIYALEDEEETIRSPDAPVPARFDEALRFDDVVFSYGKGEPVLRKLSFCVRKGEHVAVVGHTGAGKSTLVKLMNRLYDIDEGAITLDGADIRTMELGALRRLSTAVPQDVFLFAGTLRENLCFGRPDVSDEVLADAIRACQAEDVLERHGGLGARVAERGQNFSLGERQLLALVRALVTDPPILIFDEATASVDRDTERRLQHATERLMAGRTAIIVAHRLSTIRRCDRILVLHQGQLVESGSHEELMEQGGVYARLVALQARESGEGAAMMGAHEPVATP